MDVTIPIIAVTAMHFTEKSFKLAEEIFECVLQKPIKLGTLLEVVDTYSLVN